MYQIIENWNGGFSCFLFSPLKIPILTIYFFQIGWNHQPENYCLYFETFYGPWRTLAQRSTREFQSSASEESSLSSGFTVSIVAGQKPTHQPQQTLHPQNLRNPVGWSMLKPTLVPSTHNKNCSTLATHPQKSRKSTGQAAGCFPGLRTAKNSEFFWAQTMERAITIQVILVQKPRSAGSIFVKRWVCFFVV